MDATTAAAMVRRGDASARELVISALASIDTSNTELNAVVELRAERALAEALEADEATARGVQCGPLHGVPVTVKESFQVNGLRSTWGDPARREFVASRDAIAVQRLRRGGAIVVGTTNVPYMLNDFGASANEIYGATNNPWDLTRTPGGSSGGAAAAVAAELSMLDFGSDLAGSIRLPAGFCGVYGLRATAGTIPTAGHQPPGAPFLPGDHLGLAAFGPIARSTQDIRTALRLTGGPTEPDANAYAWRLAPPRHLRMADFRVGLVLDHPSAGLTSDVRTALEPVVEAIRRSGATVVEGWPEDIEPDEDFQTFLFHVGLFLAHQSATGLPLALEHLVAQERRRTAIRAAWRRYFTDVDVFVCPTSLTTAQPHDDRPFDTRTIAAPDGERPYTDQMFWIHQASLAGMPSLSAPIGRAPDGLPVGLQVTGPHHEDDTAITFAELLAERLS